MKQTNNAIKFLLAQYRAIYKHAYVKGVLSASVLATTLLAGPAHALAFKDITKDVTVHGNSAATDGILNLNVDGGTSGVTNNNTFKLKITGSMTPDNWPEFGTNTIDVNAMRGTVTAAGVTLIIESNDSNTGSVQDASFRVVGETQDAVVTFKDVQVKKGTLDVIASASGDGTPSASGSDKNATLLADTITIGGDASKQGIANVLGGSQASGDATLGRATANNVSGSTIKVDKNGVLNLSGTTGSGSANVEGSLLELSGGLLVSNANSHINTDEFIINSGSTHFVSGATTLTSHKSTIKGTLVVSGGDLTLTPKNTTENDKITEVGYVSFESGSQLQLYNTLNIKSGSVIVEDGANLYAITAAAPASTRTATDSGSIIVNAGIETFTNNNQRKDDSSTLKISSTTLENFLKGGKSYNKQSITDNKVTETSTTSAKGSVLLASGGALEFSNTDTSVDLHKFAFASGANAVAGSITLSGAGLIKGQNLSLSDVLTNGTNNTVVSGLDSALYLDVENTLTLGSDKYSGTGTLGFAEANAKNLTVLGSGGNFTLADTVKLSSTSSVTSGDKTIITADSGSITNALTIGESGDLSVNGGIYDASDITLANDGKLSVKNTQSKTPQDTTQLVSELTIDKLTLDLSTQNKNSTVNVTGDGASLTIESLNLSETKSGNATIKAENSGEINLSGSDVQKALDLAASGTAATDAKVKFEARKGGIINIEDNITYNITATNKDAVDSVIKAAGGVINATGNITFNATLGNANDANLTNIGTWKADSFKINAKDANGKYFDEVKLSLAETSDENEKSTYTIHSSLESENKKLTLANNTIINLGEIIDKHYQDGSIDYSYGSTSGGNLEVATLALSGTSSLNVNVGSWSGSNILVNGGTFTVGQNYENTRFDSQDNVIKASFTGNNLNVSAGQANITNAGSATFNELNTSSTGKVNVNGGSLVINGTDVTADDATNNKYIAVKTEANSISVTNRGYLEFGSLAVKNSIFDKTVDATTVALKDGFASGSIAIQDNSKVKLDFEKGTTFNQDQLVDLKKKLFSGASSTGQINGVLHIGSAAIDGLDDKFVTSGGNISISWEDLNQVSDIEQNADVTNDKLISATVTGVNSAFKSHVGSVVSTSSNVEIGGDASFNNAKGNNNFYASYNGQVANATVQKNNNLSLNNGGEIGTISLSENSSIATGETGETIIASISGSSGDFYADAQKTTVKGDVSVNSVENDKAEATLVVQGKLTADGSSYFNGAVSVAQSATFNKDLYIAGKAVFNDNLTVKGDAEFYGNTNVAKTLDLSNSKYSEIANNAAVVAQDVKLAANQTLYVGSEAGTDDAGNSWESSAGYLDTNNLNMNGATLIADPEYGNRASIVAVNTLGTASDVKHTEGGKLNGQLVAARNSIIALGIEASESQGSATEQVNTYLLSAFADSQGSLKSDEIGAIAFVGKALDVSNGSKIVVDSTKGATAFENSQKLEHEDYDEKYTKAINESDIYLGTNSALAIDEDALVNPQDGLVRGAIHFDKENASIYGDGGKIILTGDSFNTQNAITLFTDNDKGEGKQGILVKNQDIVVESLSGLFIYTLEKDKETTTFNLKFNNEAAKTKYLSASGSVRDTLLAYGARDKNWENANEANYKRDIVHNGVASNIAYVNGQYVDSKTQQAVKNQDAYDHVTNTDPDGVTTTTVYHKAYNNFLERVVFDDQTGQSAETAAHLGVYGGATQAALAVGFNTADAIAARMGMGAQNSGMTFADNGQGAGLWITPMYKNNESDGFASQNASYGVDMDMYGLALGGDYTMSNGLRLGLMFNVGSGDADGKGSGQGISNDFNYYGFSFYTGFSIDKFSVVGDISYSVVDNDVSANTAVDKIKSSLDSTALSVGVTGQYALALNGLDVTPHAALRFTRIDMDDYSIHGEKYGEFAHNDSSNLNVFSIPVGVTISKDIVAGSWTVKPSFDLTLTGQFGDDEYEGKVYWNGVENLQTDTKSEVMDSFYYGASLGVAAKTGNFSLGLEANYTGSSNTDEYGISANARFVF